MYLLSKREKFLLSVMAILGLAVGMICFLIKPALDQSLVYKAELQEAQVRQQGMTNVLNKLAQAEKDVSERRASLKEAAAKYYAPMSTEAVGETLVSMMDLYNLTAQSMTVSERGPKTIALYVRDGQSNYTYSYLEDLRAAGEVMGEAGNPDSDLVKEETEAAGEETEGGAVADAVGQFSQSLTAPLGEEYLEQMDGMTESLENSENLNVSLAAQLICSSVTGKSSGENGEIRAFLNSVEENGSMQMKEFSITYDIKLAKYVLDYTVDVYMLDQLPEEG